MNLKGYKPIWRHCFSAALLLVLLTPKLQARVDRSQSLRFSQCGEYFNTIIGGDETIAQRADRMARREFHELETERDQTLAPLRQAVRRADSTLSQVKQAAATAQSLPKTVAELDEEITQKQTRVTELNTEISDIESEFCFSDSCARERDNRASNKQRESQALQNRINLLNQWRPQLEAGGFDDSQVTEAEQKLKDAQSVLKQAENDNPKPDFQALIDQYTAQLNAESEAAEKSTEAQAQLCNEEWNLVYQEFASILDKFGISPTENHETQEADLSGHIDLSAETATSHILHDINAVGNNGNAKYPIVVDINPKFRESDVVVVEILTSSEKSKPDNPSNEALHDDFLISAAKAWNQKPKPVTVGSGKKIQIRVRKVASGDAYQFIFSGQYRGKDGVGLAYSPSNELWGAMLAAKAQSIHDFSVEMVEVKKGKAAQRVFEKHLKSKGIEPTPETVEAFMNTKGLVSNEAGIFMKKDKYASIFPDSTQATSCGIVEKAISGEIKMGYTNPYVSSTGLNFLWTALNCLAIKHNALPTDQKVVDAFREFQKNVPSIFETTLQMRESIRTTGDLDAGVIESQSFVNSTVEQKNSRGRVTGKTPWSDMFVFIPFGIRHENPLLYIQRDRVNSDLNQEFKRATEQFADFVGKRVKSVKEALSYGFYNDMSYASAYQAPQDGTDLIQAQKIWKNNKSGGIEVIASFWGDVTGSMKREGRMEHMKAALEVASQYVRSDMNVGLNIYSGDGLFELLPIGLFTEEAKGRFVEASRGLVADGGTPLYESLAAAIHQVVNYKPELKEAKRIVIFLTDGVPNNNTVQRRDPKVDALLFHARKMGVQVHAIGLGSGANFDLLGEITTWTNGALLKIKDPGDTKTALSKLFNSQF